MPNQKNPEGGTSPTQMEPTGTLEVRAREFISSKNPLQRGSNCKIILISPDDVSYIWETVLPHIEAMEPHSEGELSPVDFYEALTNAEMQLWVAIEKKEILASMITQIVPYPRKRVLRIISIGGEDMEKWLGFMSLLEEWALSVGCTSLECWGRKGWLKVLKDWKCSYHIITKDLTARMH